MKKISNNPMKKKFQQSDEENLQQSDEEKLDDNKEKRENINKEEYLLRKKENETITLDQNNIQSHIKDLRLETKNKSKRLNFKYDGIEKKMNKIKKPKNIMRNKDFIIKKVENNLKNILQDQEVKKELSDNSFLSDNQNNEFIFFNDANEIDNEL